MCGVLMMCAGVGTATNHGRHAINPAPVAATVGFFVFGIFLLAIGIAQIREQRPASDD
jgi:hypothetical protein